MKITIQCQPVLRLTQNKFLVLEAKFSQSLLTRKKSCRLKKVSSTKVNMLVKLTIKMK